MSINEMDRQSPRPNSQSTWTEGRGGSLALAWYERATRWKLGAAFLGSTGLYLLLSWATHWQF